jgi:alkyldihydroxyacetonephosphate synthase
MEDLGRQTSPDPSPELRAGPLENQEQWRTIKRQTTEAILAAGGTLSHHHGVGRDHAPWLEEEIGTVGMQALRALKQTFDPGNIMNPGVLLTT